MSRNDDVYTCDTLPLDEESTERLHRGSLDYHNVYTMFKDLFRLPPNMLPKARHLRVYADPEDLIYIECIPGYLPGLKLDTLTVVTYQSAQKVNKVGDDLCYRFVNDLVSTGIGWKKFYFHSFTSSFLGFACSPLDPEMFPRKPQPAGWQSTLEYRDGAQSEPSVTISRSIYPSCPVIPGKCDPFPALVDFRQPEAANRDPYNTYHKVEDAAVMAEGEKEKEVLVEVKRGEGVEYGVDGTWWPDMADRREVLLDDCLTRMKEKGPDYNAHRIEEIIQRSMVGTINDA